MSPESPDPQPPPPTGAPASEEKASGGMRALGLALGLVLAFAAAVMIAVAVDIGDSVTCDEFPTLTPAEQLEQDNECFKGSSTQKSASVALAYLGGGVGAIAVLLALAFVITGRRGRALLPATGAAVLFGGLSILVGSV